jgi:hypothetical protein
MQVIDRVVVTDWGASTITGCLGQRHFGLLEQIRFHALRHDEMSNGGLKILVDPYQLKKGLTGDIGVYSHQGLWKLLHDIAEAEVGVYTPNFHSVGHIIDNVSEAKATAYNPLTKANRPLMQIDLGSVGMMFLNEDIGLYYDPTPISSIRYGFSQAVARWVLSMENEPEEEWELDEVINAVWGKVFDKRIQDRREGEA